MHGNVWEWCQSLYKPYPHHHEEDRREELNIIDSRVLRGGAYGYDPSICRSASRGRHDPAMQNRNWGFRVVCAPRS